MHQSSKKLAHRRRTLERGEWAESFAEQWLQQHGLTPHARNYTRRLGEVDLIMREARTNSWVFVEVKYRRARAQVSGAEAIDARKQHLFRQTRTNNTIRQSTFTPGWQDTS